MQGANNSKSAETGTGEPLQRAGRVAAARGTSPRQQGFLADRRGASAFEFALLLPLMLTMAFGTVQYAMLFYTQSAMQSAVDYVAETVQRGDLPASSAEAVARTMLPPWVPAADATFVTIDAVKGAPVVVRLTVNSDKAAIVPYAPMPATIVVATTYTKNS